MRQGLCQLTIVLALCGLAPTFAHAADEADEAEEQVEFGIDMAQRGLWHEAAFRFRRAGDIDPTYAAAFNNLGIAYEQLGRLDEARLMYEHALSLAPDEPMIRENVERFTEIDDRRPEPLPQSVTKQPGW